MKALTKLNKLNAAFVAAGLALTASTASAVILSSASAPATTALDIWDYSNFQNNVDKITRSDGGKGVGNTFTTSADPNLGITSASLKIGSGDNGVDETSGSEVAYTLSIFNWAGDTPGSLIFSEALTGANTLADGDWITLEFSGAPVALASSTQYGFVINATVGSLAYTLNDIQKADGLSGEHSLVSNGGVPENHGRDAAFHVNIVTVPEPSSAALLGLGGLALILRRRK